MVLDMQVSLGEGGGFPGNGEPPCLRPCIVQLSRMVNGICGLSEAGKSAIMLQEVCGRPREPAFAGLHRPRASNYGQTAVTSAQARSVLIKLLFPEEF